ncbi:hypothetical protein GQ53DRAFT_670182 [Thozetella sp. PMI_491]|nr:hypothetical protein GQ53DRAFT_670182 [Thozetella sp. PMI_491]
MDASQPWHPPSGGHLAPANISPPLRRSLTVGSGSPPVRSAATRATASPSLASLYRDERYSDLLLTCQGRKFKVHKAIVCPQCPFFDRACTSGFLDSQQGSLDLPDVDPNVLECVIKYLYTGRYSDGDPETESPSPPEEVIQRPRSSQGSTSASSISGDENFRLAFALSSPYLGPSTDQPSVYNHQNLLALQSVPAWDDNRFRFPGQAEPEETAESPWYTGSQFNYGGHIDAAEQNQPLSKARGASRSLYLHLQVYVMAEQYGIASLKTYASARFTRTAETRWGQLERFPDIVDELFQTTARHDPLRDYAAELVAKYYKDVMFRSWMRPILEKHNELTLGVLDKMVELPGTRGHA